MAAALVGLAALADAGRILIWMPVGSKSMKITYLPLAEELVRRGHEVVIVHPFKSEKPLKGITEIVSTTEIKKLLDQIST